MSPERDRLSVLVFDDEKKSAADLQRRLQRIDGLQVTTLDDPDEQLRVLENRRQSARTQDGEGPTAARDSTDFDDADILVVDYDLAGSADEPGAAAETGERVAYLVRCYSDCGYIVGLNQYTSRPTFDLTMAGNPRSYADLNISNDEVAHDALWGGSLTGFQPWWWPNLREVSGQLRNRAAQLSLDPAVPLLALVGLTDPRVYPQLTRSQSAWATPPATGLAGMRAQDVLAGRMGLRPKDKLQTDHDRHRVAAARISKWIDRVVLPGQNILVDAPHLLSRYPSLARDPDNLAAVDLRRDIAGSYLERERLTAAELNPLWHPRPVWLWPLLLDQPGIAENENPFADRRPPGAFCEDVSRFLPVDQARKFVCDFEPFSRRYVASPPEGHPLREGEWDIGKIDYEPSVAFASAR